MFHNQIRMSTATGFKRGDSKKSRRKRRDRMERGHATFLGGNADTLGSFSSEFVRHEKSFFDGGLRRTIYQPVAEPHLQTDPRDRPQTDLRDWLQTGPREKHQTDQRDWPQTDPRDWPQTAPRERHQTDQRDWPQTGPCDEPQTDPRDWPPAAPQDWSEAENETRQTNYQSKGDDTLTEGSPKSPLPDIIILFGVSKVKFLESLNSSLSEANYPPIDRRMEICGRDVKVELHCGNMFLAEGIGHDLLGAWDQALANLINGLRSTNYSMLEKPMYLPRKKFPRHLENVDPSLSSIFKVVYLKKPVGPAFPVQVSGAVHYVTSEDELWQYIDQHGRSRSTADLFVLNIDKDQKNIVQDICKHTKMILKPLAGCSDRGLVAMPQLSLRDIYEKTMEFGGENIKYRVIPPGSIRKSNKEDASNEGDESGEQRPPNSAQTQDIADTISPWIAEHLIILEVVRENNELETPKELIFQSVRDCPELEEFIIEKKKELRSSKGIYAEALIDRKVVGQALSKSVKIVKQQAAQNALENLKQCCYYIEAKRSYFGFHGDTLPEFLTGPNRVNKTKRYRIVEPSEIKSESDVSKILRQFRAIKMEDLFFLDDFSLEERDIVVDLAKQMMFQVRQFDRDCICVYKKNRPKPVFKELMGLDEKENEKYKLIIPPKKLTRQATGLDQNCGDKKPNLQRLFDFNTDKKPAQQLYDENHEKEGESLRSSSDHKTASRGSFDFRLSDMEYSCSESVRDKMYSQQLDNPKIPSFGTDSKSTNEILEDPSKEIGHCYDHNQDVKMSSQETLSPWFKGKKSHDQRLNQETEKQNKHANSFKEGSRNLNDRDQGGDLRQSDLPPWIRDSHKKREESSKISALFDTGSDSVAFQSKSEDVSVKGSSNKMSKLFDSGSNIASFQRLANASSMKPEGSIMPRHFDSEKSFESKERIQVDNRQSNQPPWVRDAHERKEEASNKMSSLFGSGPSNQGSNIRQSEESYQKTKEETNKMSILFGITASNSKLFQSREQPKSKLFNKLYDRSSSARKERLEMERQADRSSMLDIGKSDYLPSTNYRSHQSRDHFMPSNSQNFNRNSGITPNKEGLWNRNIKHYYDQLRPY